MGNAILSLIFFFYIYKFPYGSDNNQFGVFIFLPKNKNNKASSLTNLFRNQGGSFGIAFVTTMISRRSQYHQNILVAHISNAQNAFRNNAAATQAYLAQHGFSHADSITHSAAQLYAKVQSQAAILSFLDCFWLLGAFALIGPVLACFIRKFNQNAGAGAAH